MELIVTISSIFCLALGIISMSMIFSKNILSKKPSDMEITDEKEFVKLKKTHYFVNGIILVACSLVTMLVTHHYFSIYLGIILMVFVNVNFQRKYRDIFKTRFL